MLKACLKEQQQLAAIRESVKTEEEEKQKSKESKQSEESKSELDHDFEGGFGGQEALEDRYVMALLTLFELEVY
ncbi:hypothetical protein NM688_g9132 [Phlebia brevispora]|uniref:Uncharacterized protein n=1 Tax=Phlebia brevispora TaxID=194682 RepID=A0ACC1RKJ3_9APHY|nr:hypothetical protein NM688_g9132 [Phlebia brevispora]